MPECLYETGIKMKNYEDMPECLYETGIKKNPLFVFQESLYLMILKVTKKSGNRGSSSK